MDESIIVLSFVEGIDPYDGSKTKVKEKWLEYTKDGKWKLWSIFCYDSALLGLGQCLCNSHDPYQVEEVSEEEVRKILSSTRGRVTLC